MVDNKPRLGEQTDYPEHYDPDLLVSIPRAQGRALLEIPRPMYGADIWTAYELSWLDGRGKPRVAIGEFRVDCDTPYLVESKSLKLYLNSLNQHHLESQEALAALLTRDLSAGFGGAMAVTLSSLDDFAGRGITRLSGTCLDDLDIRRDTFDGRSAALIRAAEDNPISETLYSHLLKTNCPVTGQPDWASVSFDYRGPKIDREGLLEYLVSFRQHQDFHENCVETIFSDILARCVPTKLSVYARYTRRGGLDINPYRSTERLRPEFCRLARQ